jgi:hypothetical protein
VSVTDLVTGTTKMLVQRNDWGSLDGIALDADGERCSSPRNAPPARCGSWIRRRSR